MSRRLLAPLFAIGLLSAACGTEPPAFVDPLAGAEARFLPQVVDELGDAGRGASISVDADGAPHVAYIGLAQPEKAGQQPQVRPIGSPEVPAVLVADQAEGLWNHTAVTQGAKVSDVSETAIAVDADGVSHVVWTERPVGIAYANDDGGEFSAPERVTGDRAFGISAAVAENGTVWVAWVTPGAVRAASGGAGSWSVEDVAAAGYRNDLPLSASIQIGSDGQPVVAYTDPGADAPMLARRSSSGTWTTEPIASGGGGYGISLDLDADGNPHVAYYTQVVAGEAEVRHAHDVGAGWEVSEVGAFDAGTANEDELPSLMSTAIGVDADGIHLIAWYAGEGAGLGLVSNAEGNFEEVATTGTDTGAAPSMDVAEDGTAHLAWYDGQELDLKEASYGDEEVILAHPVPETPITIPTTAPTGGTACPDGSVEIVASSGAATAGFDQTSVQAPPEPFTLCFDNRDAAPHNVHVFQGGDNTGESVAVSGTPAPGPVIQTTDVPALDPADYFFQCDVHLNMTGTLAVG